jgi:hypothetical protein
LQRCTKALKQRASTYKTICAFFSTQSSTFAGRAPKQRRIAFALLYYLLATAQINVFSVRLFAVAVRFSSLCFPFLLSRMKREKKYKALIFLKLFFIQTRFCACE